MFIGFHPRSPAFARFRTTVFGAALAVYGGIADAQQMNEQNRVAASPVAYGQFVAESSGATLPPMSPLPPIVTPQSLNSAPWIAAPPSNENAAAAMGGSAGGEQDPRREPALA